ncbi:hypothetical protein [Bacteriovorax sp. Seq25_V]|uniref:hypothetical protein n=1 Tax=Bacteriovorax sp. Seq25_V TaxID=1201288 RepID=UPI00054D4912|nr:hypothetical protein [Bacteriovorax sp. Seq25_V]
MVNYHNLLFAAVLTKKVDGTSLYKELKFLTPFNWGSLEIMEKADTAYIYLALSSIKFPCSNKYPRKGTRYG